MSHPRPTSLLPSSARQPSLLNHPPSASSSTTTGTQSTLLHSRIAAKRAELDQLRHLRDLSGDLATQMSILEQKVGTLRDGTEAVACILANWDGVLRAIGMASSKIHVPQSQRIEDRGGEAPPELPVTLVRIPVQQQKSEGRSNGEEKETDGG